MKRRIFITTGNYSLLNCLAIISLQDSNFYDDDLYILSFQYSESFKNANLKIAALHNFKHINFITSIEPCLINIFSDYDEIYYVIFTGLIHNLIVDKYYINKRYILFNESSSFAAWNPKIFMNSKNIFINNFLDKFSFPNNKKIRYIDKNRLQKICDRIGSENELRIETPVSKKSVLLLGHYSYYSILGTENTLKYYIDLIRTFAEFNFEVYFHPHPRELTDDIKRFASILNSYDARILHSAFPLETCQAQFSCVAGSFSNLLLTYPYLKGIPAIHFKMPEIYEKCQDLTLLKALYVVEYYTPDITCFRPILSLDDSEFNRQARQIYWKQIKRKLSWRFSPKLRALATARTLGTFNFIRKYL